MRSIILKLHEQFANNKISPQQVINEAKKIWNTNKHLNSIITPIFPEGNFCFDKNNLLSCIPYTLKDNVCTKNILTTGGSKFLSNYVPCYSATCYEILKNNNAILLAKDSLDEFGLAGTGLSCYIGYVKNPNNINKIVGGSSSGSVVNVKLGISAFAIGTDTGDSIRRPASLAGVVGYKPSYGAISRYGIYPYSPSLDHVGIIANYVADCCIVANYLIKHDTKDMTSVRNIDNVKIGNLKCKKNIRFIVLKNLLSYIEPKYLEQFNNLLEKIKNYGHQIIYCDINHNLFSNLSNVYKIISFTEAYSCWNCLTGINYGVNIANDNDDYETTILKNRSNGFGDEIKKRFAVGTFLTNKDQFIDNMKKAEIFKSQIIEFERQLFANNGDCLIMPTVYGEAPNISNPSSKSKYDDWLLINNFCHSPSITIPFTKVNNMPYSITISCPIYQDMNCLNFAYTIEKIILGEDDE